MDLFLDTASLDEIREIDRWGVLRGVTTNPTLITKEHSEFLPLVREICSVVNGDVSIETSSDDTATLIEQAHEIVQIADNAIVKIAMTPNGLAAIRKVSAEGIRVNVTLVFTPAQAILAAEAGAYITSAFVGRLDDTSTDGIGALKQMCEIYVAQRYETKILAASIRSPLHVAEAARAGAAIATIPYQVFQQLVRHPLSDSGLDRFLGDWEQAKPFLGQLPSSYEAA